MDAARFRIHPQTLEKRSSRKASFAAPHEGLEAHPVGAGSDLLGKHRKSKTEEDFVRLPIAGDCEDLTTPCPMGAAHHKGMAR